MTRTLMVLAGGFGTRLRSVTGPKPKALASISGKPFLSILMEKWISHGFEKFVFLLGYGSQEIIDTLNSYNFSVNISISWSVESKPLGTGGAVSLAVKNMKLENSFCLANSDTWLDGDLRSIRFLPGNNVAVIKCAKNDRYGEVVFDEKQAVTEFIKNSVTRQAYVNVGFYKFNKSIFLNWDGENHSLEETVLPSLVNRRNLNCYVYNGNFIDIGVPDDYKKFVGIHNEEKNI